MDNLAIITKNLAENLLTLRKKRSLSQAQLAKMAGLPRSTVTYFESGFGNPSLVNLAKITSALQVSIEELLSAPRSLSKLIKSRDVHSFKKNQGLCELFKLLPDPIVGMEIDRMEISAGGRLAGIPHVANTKEYLIGIQGDVEVRLGREKYLVEAGDILAFQGDQPHSYRNVGTKKAVALSVVVIAPVGM